jgi:pimeloyl-ACP methyl ester carboxylesterase
LNGLPAHGQLLREATLKPSAEAREIITVGAASGLHLRGTYHKPGDGKSDPTPDPKENNHIGVLFVSAGVAPRAGSGDLAVHWADSLAKLGYPSFRFDLPGLGDSDGDLSAKEIDFDALVNEGAFSPVVSGVVDQLVDRFNLRGVVVIGHCAGAVTALYSAATNSRISGLILLDPYFYVQYAGEAQSVLARSQQRIVGKLLSDRSEPSILRSAVSKVLSVVRKVYYRLTPLGRLVRSKKLPDAANLPLVRCWRQLASSGLPMLVLRSPFSTPKLGEFDYIHDLHPMSDSRCRISVKLIEGATHAFAERRTKDQVLRFAEPWLRACFPPKRGAETVNAERRAPALEGVIQGISTNVR